MPCFSRVLNSLQRIKYGYVYIDTIFEIFNQKFDDNDNENTFQAKQKKSILRILTINLTRDQRKF